METIEIRKPTLPIAATVSLPGSKSLTNRALLLAAFSNGKVQLSNVLLSDDGLSFLGCLQELGFRVDVDIEHASATIWGNGGIIPKTTAAINVGSAGTTARFLTAALALSDGEYLMEASEQMKARPMQPLLQSLADLGVQFDYFGEEFFLPYKIKGIKLNGGEITVKAASSSQFLSALLLVGGANSHGLTVKIADELTAKPFVEMTLRMMSEFGVETENENFKQFIIPADQKYQARDFVIEPDLSNACYFWAAALLTGGRITVKNARFDSLQGDIRFLNVLEQMGARISESTEGITVCGSIDGVIKGIEVDLSDMPDQVLTLAAIAPFANSSVLIKNVEIIRYHESNRLEVVLTELARVGIRAEYVPEVQGIRIFPGEPHATTIDTYDDHRVAMAFSLLGLRCSGMKISNPRCVAKTFSEYFAVFESVLSR